MPVNMNQYIFTSDDGDLIEDVDLHDDDAAEKMCQTIADREKTHVTCDRVICSCDPSKDRIAEQRNVADSSGQKCFFCNGLRQIESLSGLVVRCPYCFTTNHF